MPAHALRDLHHVREPLCGGVRGRAGPRGPAAAGASRTSPASPGTRARTGRFRRPPGRGIPRRRSGLGSWARRWRACTGRTASAACCSCVWLGGEPELTAPPKWSCGQRCSSSSRWSRPTATSTAAPRQHDRGYHGEGRERATPYVGGLSRLPALFERSSLPFICSCLPGRSGLGAVVRELAGDTTVTKLSYLVVTCACHPERPRRQSPAAADGAPSQRRMWKWSRRESAGSRRRRGAGQDGGGRAAPGRDGRRRRPRRRRRPHPPSDHATTTSSCSTATYPAPTATRSAGPWSPTSRRAEC